MNICSAYPASIIYEKQNLNIFINEGDIAMGKSSRDTLNYNMYNIHIELNCLLNRNIEF